MEAPVGNERIALCQCRKEIRDLRESSLLAAQCCELVHMELMRCLSEYDSLPDRQRLGGKLLRLRVPSGHQGPHRLELHEQILIKRNARLARQLLKDRQLAVGCCDIARLDQAMEQPPAPAV